MGVDLKKRAERNGKIRRTVSKIEQTVAKLERMKVEYMQKAVDAKSRGDSASYSLAKSGLNATLTQIKRAKEMLLNIEITAELQKMGETNADFLTGMSTIAKRISKINKQSDFVKLQKEIQKALSGMEEAQAGLDGFLQNTDAQFAAISQAPGALTDRQIDELVAGRVSERELLMDDQIERIINGGTKSSPREEVGVTVDASDSKPLAAQVAVKTEPEKAEAPVAEPEKAVNTQETAMAKPFPSPCGKFEFQPKQGDAAGISVVEETSSARVQLRDVIEPVDFPTLILGRSSDGEVQRVKLSDAPDILVGGVIGSGKSSFINQFLVSLIATQSADKVRLLLFDAGGENLTVFNGIPHMACDAITDAAQFVPALDALSDELDRRYEVMSAVGARDIEEYNEKHGSLPYIVVCFDDIEAVVRRDRRGFERAFTKLARQNKAVGIYFILSARNVGEDVVTPALLSSVSARIAFRMSEDGAKRFNAVGAESITESGVMVYSGAQNVMCTTPYVSKENIGRIVAALAEDRI